jgi:signal transduction histidine kinase
VPGTGSMPQAGEPVSRWWSITWTKATSIRGRTTAMAVILVGVALLVGAVALVSVMRSALTESVRVDAEARASDVVADLEGGTAPDDLVMPTTDDLLIQVLDADGLVLVASPEAPQTALAPNLRSGRSEAVVPPGDDEPFLVVAASADGPDGARTVLAARGLELVQESTEVVTMLLAFGLPIVLLVVGAMAWLLVGRSLAPVEAIRGEVEEISSTELHRRVPTPGGTDELARLAATMNEMLTRLERGQSRQRQLVADTSHELRSPIASIRQHAEVALAHPERTTPSELAETVLAESLRLARMVDDLLLLARADEHTLALERRPLDLDDLALDAARAIRRNGHLEVDASGVSGGRVHGDPEGLRRVVANLAENAASHARARVAFSVVEDGDEVRLRVEDDGRGIAVDDRDRVFERFVRLDPARNRDAGGSGLGLAIVAELVGAHGGSVVIGESALGGTMVEVRLPRAAD